jgi:hypothetical protein
LPDASPGKEHFSFAFINKPFPIKEQSIMNRLLTMATLSAIAAVTYGNYRRHRQSRDLNQSSTSSSATGSTLTAAPVSSEPRYFLTESGPLGSPKLMPAEPDI